MTSTLGPIGNSVTAAFGETLTGAIKGVNRVIGDLTAPSDSAALPMDLYRHGDRFVARIEMPGVRRDSIDVDVEDRTVTIRAERISGVDEDVDWMHVERPRGVFTRTLTLGNRIAPALISADYVDGVLVVTIPLAPDARARKVAVDRSDQAAPTPPGITSSGVTSPDPVPSVTD